MVELREWRQLLGEPSSPGWRSRPLSSWRPRGGRTSDSDGPRALPSFLQALGFGGLPAVTETWGSGLSGPLPRTVCSAHSAVRTEPSPAAAAPWPAHRTSNPARPGSKSCRHYLGKLPLLTHSAAFARQRQLSQTIPGIACLALTPCRSLLSAGGQRHPSHPEQSQALTAARPPRTPPIPEHSLPVLPSGPSAVSKGLRGMCLSSFLSWSLPTTFPSLAYGCGCLPAHVTRHR